MPATVGGWEGEEVWHKANTIFDLLSGTTMHKR